MCVSLPRVSSTVWIDSAAHGEKRGCAPLRSVELLLAHVLQFVSFKLLQNELCASAECGWHDAGLRDFVMQNVEDT